MSCLPLNLEKTLEQKTGVILDSQLISTRTFLIMRRCGICFKKDTLRCWFGGLCCKNCRFFFIRFVQATNIQRCKNNQACFSGEGSWMCRVCRYLRCLKSGMDPYFVGKIHKPFDQPSRVKKTLQQIYNEDFSEMPALIPIPPALLPIPKVNVPIE